MLFSNVPFVHVHVVVYLFMAAWRLSNLLANEDGPFHFFLHLRSKIGRLEAKSRRKGGLISKFHLYEGVHCEYCNSIWFGTLLTIGYLFLGNVMLWIALPLIISTGAIVIKSMIFLVKSIDTRFDQQNQAHLEEKKDREDWKKQVRSMGHSMKDLDAINFRKPTESHIEKIEI